jgi:hypothetical protein
MRVGGLRVARCELHRVPSPTGDPTGDSAGPSAGERAALAHDDYSGCGRHSERQRDPDCGRGSPGAGSASHQQRQSAGADVR